MKIRALEAELFHSNGRTDRHDKGQLSLFVILRTRLKTEYFKSCSLAIGFKHN